jgi:hypothetical protein
MFSLIITIISIALVAALAVATIYYGGSAFTQGTAKASASAFVAAGQQVNGALTLFANDNGGARAANVAALVSGNYLAAAPSVSGIALTTTATGVVGVSVPTAVCDAINASANLSGAAIPADMNAAATAAAPYSCTTTKVFFFKG